MLSRQSLLLSCVCAAAFFTSSLAYAQAEGGGTQIEELVITAEKREQSLQDVPVAVSAFNDQRRELLGIKTAQDLTNFTPGLAYNTGNDRMTMRGIGRLTNNRASEGGVAIYDDGMYTSSVYPIGRSSLFLDRTEVLRGPQGTLYGRNAIGGTMNVISKRPTNDFYAEGRLGISNYNTQNYEAAVSGPLYGTIRGRLAASYNNQHKGFYTNIADGSTEGNRGETTYIEGQLDGKIGDRFEWWVKSEWYKLHALGSGAGGRQGVQVGLPNIATSLNVAGVPNSSFANFGRTTPLASSICDRCFEADTQNAIHIESQAFIGQATYHADGFDIKYIGGRYWYNYELQTDVDGTANHTPFVAPGTTTTVYPRLVNHYNEEPWWYSQELDFASTGDGPLQWIGGLYWFKEESNYTPTNATSPDDPLMATPYSLTGAPAAANPQHTYAIATSRTLSESYAAFGQLDWSPTEQFKFTAGLRYTYDKKDVVEGARLITASHLDITGLAVGTPATVYSDPSVVAGSVFTDPTNGIRYRELRNHWDGWGGTLGAEWHPDRDTMVYAKYTRGYKAGGFNSATTTLVPFVTTKKETINAYEIGAKVNPRRNLQINASAFYYDYENIQVVVQNFDQNLQQNVASYVNMPKARIYGLELESIWQPIDNLQLIASYSYLNTKIKKACCFQDSEDPMGLQPGVIRGAGSTATAVFQDLKGAHLPGATPNRVSVNANYTWDFDPGSLNASLSYVWKDATYYDIFNRYYNRAKAYDQWDANLRWNGANKNYTVIAFVRNITDAKGQVVVSGSRLTNAGPNFNFINENLSYIPPRTYGFEIQYRY
jgi:iron complex outermembrane receptor protein